MNLTTPKYHFFLHFQFFAEAYGCGTLGWALIYIQSSRNKWSAIKISVYNYNEHEIPLKWNIRKCGCAGYCMNRTTTMQWCLIGIYGDFNWHLRLSHVLLKSIIYWGQQNDSVQTKYSIHHDICTVKVISLHNIYPQSQYKKKLLCCLVNP